MTQYSKHGGQVRYGHGGGASQVVIRIIAVHNLDLVSKGADCKEMAGSSYIAHLAQCNEKEGDRFLLAIALILRREELQDFTIEIAAVGTAKSGDDIMTAPRCSGF